MKKVVKSILFFIAKYVPFLKKYVLEYKIIGGIPFSTLFHTKFFLFWFVLRFWEVSPMEVNYVNTIEFEGDDDIMPTRC